MPPLGVAADEDGSNCVLSVVGGACSSVELVATGSWWVLVLLLVLLGVGVS